MRHVLLGLVLSSLSSVATGQALLLERAGEFSGDRYGHSLADAGDVDGDGVHDVVVGTPRHAGGLGVVEVLSGADGHVLHTWTGPFVALQEYGFAVAGCGDVTGDGRAEVAFSANDPFGLNGGNVVFVKDGASGATLTTLQGTTQGQTGFALAGGGDSDGDGLLELLVGEPGHQNAAGDAVGRVLVVELVGAQATTTSVLGTTLGERFGDAVAWVDADGDGLDEFVVGATRHHQPGVTDLGRVECFDGSLASRWNVVGQTLGTRLGWSLADAGDVDGDGAADVLVGSPFGTGTFGRVDLLSGATGASLDARVGTEADGLFGSAVASVGDVDGDGVPDALVGVSNGGTQPGGILRPGEVLVLSGANLATTLGARRGLLSLSGFGHRVAATGDLTGDGKIDFAVGAPYPWTGNGVPGWAYLVDVTSSVARCEAFATGTPGTTGVPALTCSAPPVLGTAIELHLANSSGTTQIGALLAGRTDAVVPLFGGTLFLVPTILELLPAVPPNGASLPLLVPAALVSTGSRWLVQGLQLDAAAPGGVSFSRPLELVFGGW